MPIDAYTAPKFDRPGHRVTGERDKHGRPGGLGKTVVIAVQDDHSRLVYAELHSAENATNVAIALKRGAAWMREHGCGPVEAVLSDNAKCYTGHQFAQALAELGAHHIRIPPYTPRWNGKLERFFGTLEDAWVHGRVWPNSATRDGALSSFIRYFNRWRPHSAAGGRAPITRVQQVRRQDKESGVAHIGRRRSRALRRAVALAAVVALAVVTGVTLLARAGCLEQEALVARFALRHEPAPAGIVVVGIDSATLTRLGRWPFARSRHADVVDRLHRAGARAIALDIQFTEPTEPAEDLALYDAIGRAGGAVLATTEVGDHGDTDVLGGDANPARIHARAAAANLDDAQRGVVTRFPRRSPGSTRSPSRPPSG